MYYKGISCRSLATLNHPIRFFLNVEERSIKFITYIRPATFISRWASIKWSKCLKKRHFEDAFVCNSYSIMTLQSYGTLCPVILSRSGRTHLTQLAVSILWINNNRHTGLGSSCYFASRGPQDSDIMQRWERMYEEIVMLIHATFPLPLSSLE